MNGKVFSVLIYLLATATLAQASVKQQKYLRLQVRPAVMSLSRIMMHDVVSPTIASRYYMYCSLASMELLRSSKTNGFDSSLQLTKYPLALPSLANKTLGEASELAALFCIYETGMRFLPSGVDLTQQYEAVRNSCRKNGFKPSTIAQAKTLASAVADDVWRFSANDGYKFLAARPKYRPKRENGAWFPTPPAYMDAVDPYWGSMRLMMLDSANQIGCEPAAPFDTSAGSKFMTLAQEVYAVGKNPTNEQRDIAGYWDCNPFVVANAGHMSLGFKKISPGGHWMNIACLAAEKEELPFSQTVELVAIEALTLYDAFISCWYQKYASARVRPETFINAHIDLRWTPLLQTPPFPEYTSGHSVISTASAEVLSYFLGDTFAFTDDTEVMFELPVRQFESFHQAANEAAISRLYGGIHFRDGIEQGQRQGAAIGNFILQRLKQAKIEPFTKK
jgi:hypothetical protein